MTKLLLTCVILGRKYVKKTSVSELILFHKI